MWAARRQLREVYAALDAAETYGAWSHAAEEHDRLTGADQWRADDESELYDAAALRGSLARLTRLRERGDGLALAAVMTEDLYRNLNDLVAPALYTTALAGTKHLVARYLDEVDACLRWLARTEIPGLSRADVLQRFESAWEVFGHSALLLSGGATLGFHHLGVCKALHDLDLLPHILSGASTGAMIAAGVCARDEAGLDRLFAETHELRLDGLKPVGPLRAAVARAVLDPEQLYAVLRHNIGDCTFAEAFARSGRSLAISVSPTRMRQKPRLLTWRTSPEVLVARAALASSALPGLFPPVELVARSRTGDDVPYIAGERWVDGSIYGDLPMRRLSRLFNVNHFVVSQTNPHVLPFVRHHGRSGMAPAVLGLASATIRRQGQLAADVGRRVTPGQGAGRWAERFHAMFAQEYGGDIDIHPEFSWKLYAKVVANPSRTDLKRFLRSGERAVWPRVAMIRAQTRLGRVFRECVEELRARG